LDSALIIIVLGCLGLALAFFLFRSQIFILLNRLARIQFRGMKNLQYTDEDEDQGVGQTVGQHIEPEWSIQSWFVVPSEKFIARMVVLAMLSFLIFIIFASFSRVLVRLGNAEFSSGYAKFGIATYNLALEFNEDLKKAVNQCDADNTRQQYELAIHSCSKSIEIDPNYATAYFQRGYAYMNIQKYDQAISDFTKDIELIPVATRSYINRGKVYTDLNKYDLAIADFTKSIEINSADKRAWMDRGLAYISQGKIDLAIADCEKAIKLDDKYSNAYSCLGQAFSKKEIYDLALINYDKAIKLDSKESILYLSRGIIYAGQKNYDLAIADFEKAIEIEPTYVDAYIWRGNAFADSKKFSQAITDYQKAISIANDSKAISYAYCVQGITYTKMGDFRSAIPSLKEGLKMDVAKEKEWCKIALDNARQGIPTP